MSQATLYMQLYLASPCWLLVRAYNSLGVKLDGHPSTPAPSRSFTNPTPSSDPASSHPPNLLLKAASSGKLSEPTGKSCFSSLSTLLQVPDVVTFVTLSPHQAVTAPSVWISPHCPCWGEGKAFASSHPICEVEAAIHRSLLGSPLKVREKQSKVLKVRNQPSSSSSGDRFQSLLRGHQDPHGLRPLM